MDKVAHEPTIILICLLGYVTLHRGSRPCPWRRLSGSVSTQNNAIFLVPAEGRSRTNLIFACFLPSRVRRSFSKTRSRSTKCQRTRDAFLSSCPLPPAHPLHLSLLLLALNPARARSQWRELGERGALATNVATVPDRQRPQLCRYATLPFRLPRPGLLSQVQPSVEPPSLLER